MRVEWLGPHVALSAAGNSAQGGSTVFNVAVMGINVGVTR